MATVKFKGETFSCVTALKGEDYVHLLDRDGCMVAAFDGVVDFSAFEIEGEWTDPTDAHDCHITVMGDDGVIRKGGHKCSDLNRAEKVSVPADTAAALGLATFPKRNLPSGYTQVEYIETDGNQYIDTGYVPNSNTRVILNIEPTAAVTSGTAGIFGSRGNGTSNAAYQYTVMATTSSQYRSDYADDANTFIAVSPYLSRVTIDKNKNVTTINGTTVENPAAEWQGVYTAFIGKVNNNGTPTSGALVGKVYSCEIYDNVTLVRDYVPCKNSSGTAGLYDVVNGEFYGNTGSGTFAVGAECVDATVNEALMHIAVNITKYETGSYTGTGTYGVGNKCSLTFGFVPKFVEIAPTSGSNVAGGSFLIGNSCYAVDGSYLSANGQIASFDESTLKLTWYHNVNGGTARNQLNVSGQTYSYIAFG